MTVDEILATGRYTDRRGRRWTRSNYGIWMHPVAFHPVLGVRSETRQLSEMRLLIERDMHRDECVGLWGCVIHPVIHVYRERSEWGDEWVVYEPDNPTDRYGRETHQQAINVAYRLAVSSE